MKIANFDIQLFTRSVHRISSNNTTSRWNITNGVSQFFPCEIKSSNNSFLSFNFLGIRDFQIGANGLV